MSAVALAQPAASSATISHTPEWPRAGDVVVFTNSYDFGNVTWDFGDGTTTTANGSETPSHAYAAPGIYTVTATWGCEECERPRVHRREKSVVVLAPAPGAVIGFDEVVPGAAISTQYAASHGVTFRTCGLPLGESNLFVRSSTEARGAPNVAGNAWCGEQSSRPDIEAEFAEGQAGVSLYARSMRWQGDTGSPGAFIPYSLTTYSADGTELSSDQGSLPQGAWTHLAPSGPSPDRPIKRIRVSGLLGYSLQIDDLSTTGPPPPPVPLARVSPRELRFDKTPVGRESKTQSVTVENAGTGPLEVGQLELSGLEPEDFRLSDDGCNGASLAPGQTCTASLSFAPTESGPAFADLLIPSNSPEGRQTVGLSGEAPQQPRASFRWSMPPRYGYDESGRAVIEENNSRGAVFPQAGRELALDACSSFGGGGGDITSYEWEWSGPEGTSGSSRSGDCRSSVRVPHLGQYQMKLTVRTPDSQSHSATQALTVRDHLIVSVGDSYASGQGNPDVPGRWVYKGPVTISYSPPNIKHDPENEGHLRIKGKLVARRHTVWSTGSRDATICNRSTLAGAAQAARVLEDRDPHSTVTFVHLACGGATIDDGKNNGGLLTPYKGQVPDHGGALKPQVDQLMDLVGCEGEPGCYGTRPIDALVVSAGGNDLGFADIINGCAFEPKDCHTHKHWVYKKVHRRLAWLPGRYRALKARLDAFRVRDTYLTEYPDLTRSRRGNPSRFDGVFRGITEKESGWLSRSVSRYLNEAVAAAAREHGWRYVGGMSARFKKHGYPAGNQSYVRHFFDSISMQGAYYGVMHPNAHGQAAQRDAYLDAIRLSP